MRTINTFCLFRSFLRSFPGHLPWFNHQIYRFHIKHCRFSIYQSYGLFSDSRAGKKKICVDDLSGSLIASLPSLPGLICVWMFHHFNFAAGTPLVLGNGSVKHQVFVFNRVMDLHEGGKWNGSSVSGEGRGTIHRQLAWRALGLFQCFMLNVIMGRQTDVG